MLKTRDEFLIKYLDKTTIKSIIITDKGNNAVYDVLDNIRTYLRNKSDGIEVYRRSRIFFYRSKWERFYSIEDLEGVV